MTDAWWSYILTAVGLTGFILVGKKVWWGWYVNLACQVLWVAYALVSDQFGFLISAIFYSVVFGKNSYAWSKEHREKADQKQKIVAKLREPIGKITLLEDRPEGIFARGEFFCVCRRPECRNVCQHPPTQEGNSRES